VIPQQRLSEPARPLHEAIGLRLRRGLLAAELLPGLDDIRILVSDAMQSSEDDFGSFLLGLNTRLAETGSVVAAAESEAQRRIDSSRSLDDALRRGMDSMRNEVADSTDIVQIKQQVSERVDTLSLALDAFRNRERDMQVELEHRTQLLRERISELDQQVRDAEARLAEQRHLALTDALTQLPNREAYSRKLHEEVARWNRYGHPLSLVLCDVDHFKKVNDNFGHASGDEVLRLVARLLREGLRETDFVARYGGEEFVILLPETATRQAREVMNQVRESIAAASLSTGEQRIRVTASFGIAGFNEGDASDRVFRRADAALYQAKNDGRNRVCIYSMDSPQF
jgi:diguanylate cyclase